MYGLGISVEALTALASIVGGVGIALSVGRVAIHWNSENPITRCADYLNAGAALVLVVFLAVQCHYLPLYEAIVLRGNLQGPPASPTDRALFYRVQLAVYMVFWIVLYLVKFSLLMLYRVLFGVSKGFRATWWGVFAFTILAFLVDFISALWLCGSPRDPVNYDMCHSRAGANVGLQVVVMGSVLNIVSDLAIMALALGMLPRLQMSFKKKLGLAAIFLLALVVVAFDITRVVITYTEGTSYAFDAVEPPLAVIICALPIYGRACTNASQWLHTRLSSLSKTSVDGGGSRGQSSKQPSMSEDRSSTGSTGGEAFRGSGAWLKASSTWTPKPDTSSNEASSVRSFSEALVLPPRGTRRAAHEF